MCSSSIKELLFVYNANSGVVNSWMDIAHKVLQPSTYECHLCALTHGSFREKRIWKNFKNDFAIPMEFYHKDEFLKKYKSKWLPKYEFPIILMADGAALQPLLTAQDFQEIETVQDLIQRLKDLTQ